MSEIDRGQKKVCGKRVVIAGGVFFVVGLVVVMVMSYAGSGEVVSIANALWTVLVLITLLTIVGGGILWVVETIRGRAR